ncbi:MAG: ABC transporter ATP-binding protein [Candidatus Omnitrophica bacterium]|nr:ABC transporter ATP-binding protein [Candidatus Omnitrophota bacterium]MBU4479638.1 ABC transporter ATP-binding protein [Candidatus Omnitrophota bacterium]MCG2703533.1 ABC transporter ATP-binding protein [Candidatus Omnitrophota bacterium]
MLKVKNISKQFIPALPLSARLINLHRKNSPVTALKDISFSLEKGSILGILGPNGAGKTTLLKIISTIILADKGTVRVDNYSPGRDDEKIKSITGLMSNEERSFYWRLTGRQNLEFFAAMHGLDKRNAESRLKEYFTKFKITYQDKRFDSYSSGMKRIFSLIKTILHDPRLVLLDEPTKSLDYNTSLKLRNFIRELSAAGKAVLLATHNIQEAEELCDSFLIIYQGKTRAIGALDELRKGMNNSSATLTDIYLKLTQNA